VKRHVSKDVQSTANLPLKFTCALSEEVISAVHVYHTIFEDTLPLIFDASDLVISAKYNVAFPCAPLINILVISSV
jgi:hypothetical protein